MKASFISAGKISAAFRFQPRDVLGVSVPRAHAAARVPAALFLCLSCTRLTLRAGGTAAEPGQSMKKCSL